MENNWIYFDGTDEYALLKAYKQYEYLGYVYIVEFGNDVKIGCTQDPYGRMMALKNTGSYGKKELGRLALSKECTNFPELEKELHNHFKKWRHGKTELFEICFDYAINNCPKLQFVDESDEIDRSISDRWYHFFHDTGLGDALINGVEKLQLENLRESDRVYCFAKILADNPETMLRILYSIRDKYIKAIGALDELISHNEEYISEARTYIERLFNHQNLDAMADQIIKAFNEKEDK